MTSNSKAPATTPSTVPASARNAVDPVAAALPRNTDNVPSTTQKPCSTPLAPATTTAALRATAPRRLLTNHTERRLVWGDATRVSEARERPPGKRLRRLPGV